MLISPRQLLILRMKLMGRMSQAEIARQLKIGEGAVSHCVKRARTKLMDAGLMNEREDWEDLRELLQAFKG